MCLSVIFVLTLLSALVENNGKVIKIRGLGSCQYLPTSQALSWPVWTYDISESSLVPVESDESSGWVNPTDCDEIYFPRDLPLPKCRPSLGMYSFYIL